MQSVATSRVTLFAAPRALRCFDFPSHPRLCVVEQPSAEKNPLARVFWFEAGLARATRMFGADALLCLHGCGLGPADVPTYNLIQQSLPFSQEALARLGVRNRLKMRVIRALMHRACGRTTKVLVQTETMQRAVVRVFGLPAEKVLVATTTPPALLRVERKAREASALDLMRDFNGHRLLYVGNEVGYKNVAVVLEAVRLVRGQGQRVRLFATWNGNNRSAADDALVRLGYLDPPGLAEAYGEATVLVMPSLVETVGLPMLEAMAAATPVLAADRPYAREVCGGAALHFDPLSARDLADKLALLLDSPERRETLVRLGKQRVEDLTASRPYDYIIDAVMDRRSC